MHVTESNLFSKKGECIPMPKQSRTRNRHFFRLSAGGTLMALLSSSLAVLPIEVRSGSFLVSAAHAQSQFEEDVQKFEKDVKEKSEKIAKDVQREVSIA